MLPNGERSNQEKAKFWSDIARVRPGTELGLVLVLVLLLVWRIPTIFPPGSAAKTTLTVVLFALLLAALLASWLGARPGWSVLGLAPRDWTRGWLSLVVFSAGATLGLYIFSLFIPAQLTVPVRLSWVGRVIPEIVVQQLLIQGFFNNRIFGLTEGLASARRLRITVLATAALIVLAHAPNYPLMIAILPAAIFWSWHFRVFRNLPALVLSHLVLGAALRTLVDRDLLLHMNTGLEALRKLGVLCGWYGPC